MFFYSFFQDNAYFVILKVKNDREHNSPQP
jgi:hypothetical protein